MEIISVFGINWKLLLIQAFNFGVLLLVLWYFLYRPVVAMLERRQRFIEQGVKDSEEASARLAEIEAEKSAKLTEASRAAEEVVRRAEERAHEKESEIVKRAEEKSDKVLSEAAARALEAKERARKESEAEIARLAILGMEKLLREKARS